MKLEIRGSFFLLMAAALLMGAEEVLPLVLMAALSHEAAHLAVLRLTGAKVKYFRLSALGAEIRADTRYLPYGREILCVLAGPAANLILAVLFAKVSKDDLLAGANLLLGLFNLLPVSVLDGGRALRLLITWLTEPYIADRICDTAGTLTAAALVLATGLPVVRGEGGGFLLFGACGLLFSQLSLVKKGETG